MKTKLSLHSLVLRLSGILLLLATPALSIVLQTVVQTPKPPASEPLESGRTIEKTVSAGQTHSFTIDAKAGQYLHVIVDQRGVDLVVTLFGPDGAKIVDIDQTEAFGAEIVLGVIQVAGEYRLDVRPVGENT